MDRQTDTGAHRYNRIRGHGSELPPDRGRHQRSITTCLEPGGWGDSGPRFVPMRQRRKEVRAGRDREGCVGRKEGILERDRQIQGQ